MDQQRITIADLVGSQELAEQYVQVIDQIHGLKKKCVSARNTENQQSKLKYCSHNKCFCMILLYVLPLYPATNALIFRGIFMIFVVSCDDVKLFFWTKARDFRCTFLSFDLPSFTFVMNFFNLARISKQSVPNHYPEHFLFMWIVLRTVILHFFLDLS